MLGLKEILQHLHLEQIDTCLFRGYTIELPLPQVYGGQVLAQALNAASRTVSDDRHPHSLHGYFLRRGDQSKPIIYEVDPIRDGGSFSTRRVVAKQNGKAIFNCSISFQVVEGGLEHQIAMPADIPEPESLKSDRELMEGLLEEGGQRRNIIIIPDGVLDMKRVNASNPLQVEIKEPVKGIWFRFKDSLPDGPALHRTLLTYISDWGLLEASLYPHPINFFTEGLQVASLDHAMWFHQDFRVDDWIYYHIDSPRTAHSRGFNRGSFYTKEGVLVASAAQEGLIRLKRDED